MHASRGSLGHINSPMINILVNVPGGEENEPTKAKHLLVLFDRRKAPQSLEVAWKRHCLELVKLRPDPVMNKGWLVSAVSDWEVEP